MNHKESRGGALSWTIFFLIKKRAQALPPEHNNLRQQLRLWGKPELTKDSTLNQATIGPLNPSQQLPSQGCPVSSPQQPLWGRLWARLTWWGSYTKSYTAASFDLCFPHSLHHSRAVLWPCHQAVNTGLRFLRNARGLHNPTEDVVFVLGLDDLWGEGMCVHVWVNFRKN